MGLLQLSHRNIKLPNILSWKGPIGITEFNSWLHAGSPKNETIEMKEMFLNLKGDLGKKVKIKDEIMGLSHSSSQGLEKYLGYLCQVTYT